jgi:hypothetical protein
MHRIPLLAILALAAAAHATAGAIVVASYEKNAADGIFTYSLSVRNTCPDCDLAGLLVKTGDTVFNLNIASAIGSPDGWSAIPPVPFVIDDLAYMSQDPAKDIKPGDTLEGFTFKSFTSPNDIKPGDFAVEVICRKDGKQIAAGNAIVLPEPSGAALGAMGLSALVILGVRRARYRG